MFISKVSIFVTLCLVFASCEDEKPKMCPFLAACIKETDGKVKPEDLKQLMEIKEPKQVDDIPVELLCVMKCALEKRKVLVNDKIDMEKLKDDKKMMKMVDKPEEFEECVKKIETISKCEDMKDFMKCKTEFFKKKDEK